ncbi:hypothetical protein FF011L_25560 [Roseimaritima multifibrata]|uniref:Neutral/alkaline non-lysosomal ceramidase n=1 Tax=Roseimaritima multifibrata TaxID=1930274 RepID=A0A517MFX2_9BACT|nr:hypothetical protein [Roseimaritima multifibrata]QDS93783.1 hypothetical protein FF011L_25560 [Roseimaritima multifibrata]
MPNSSNGSFNRRTMIAGTAAGSIAASVASAAAPAPEKEGKLSIGLFRFDVTPPTGHPLCGGWIKPVEAVDDPLEAIGYVLQGCGKPIVVCVVDWTGLLNSAHIKWRQALADGAGTTIDRVTVHCVHQHNAPFACLDANEILTAQGDLPLTVEPAFFDNCLKSAKSAAQQALESTVPVTHVATGQAEVEKVAGNRRLIGLDGKVRSQRGSSSKSPAHQIYPEGLIDPMLKQVAFYNGDKKVAACYYYACHPMSYYGDGRVSSDFCGLARKQMQIAEPDCTHMYFNGCGGNIGAGKYNDGSKEMRPILMNRILTGMQKSSEALEPKEITSVSWVTKDILPPVNPSVDEDKLMQQISDHGERVVNRNRPSYAVAWSRRIKKKIPVTLSGLHLNNVSLIHLPSESFIEYQLRAQAEAPDRFVACAAYGDGGPWYIPTADAFPQGGYAASVAWCAPAIDPILSTGIKDLLTKV